ncbi:hypothetical protein HJFPF1_01320 [Paramyrothecium foliicola]|nr:hypothetical protein HJFPF1_01320 [Paramyrothecium foliicola]
MEPSTSKADIDGTLKDAYDVLSQANQSLENVIGSIIRISWLWKLTSDDRDDSNRPEHWVDPTGHNEWFRGNEWRAWYRQAQSNGLLYSKPVLRAELTKLGGLRREREQVQQSIRDVINKRSRQHVRPWHVLDLPEEGLANLFEILEGYRPDWTSMWHVASDDIKNCRLTCQKFCRASSRFFIRSIAVDQSAASMARFQAISRHPIISRGVRTVRVLLHFFDPSLGDDPVAFILHHVAQLEEYAETIKTMKPWKFGSTTEEDHMEILEKVNAAINHWYERFEGPPAPHGRGEDCSHCKLLEQAHQQYRNLYLRQEDLWESGEFSRTIAAGMANMPHARTLSMADTDILLLQKRSLFDCQDVNAQIYRDMLRPMNYYEASRYGIPPRLSDLTTKIPVAVHQAGALLENVQIKLSYVKTPASLLPAQEVRQQLPSAMRHLKEFSFACGKWVSSAAGEEALYKTLAPCLDTSTLRELKLDVSSDEELDDGGDQRPLGLGSLITSRPWPNLSYLILRGITIHLSELQLFIERRKGSPCDMSLDHVRLLSGTWAEVLDTLRGKSGILTKLEDPLGAECDVMAPDELADVFGREEALARNAAEHYVCEVTAHNPLIPGLG